MQRGQTVYLSCQLSKSAFSGERVFRVTLTDGKEYVGVSPVGYCLNANKRLVQDDEPTERSTGFVEGRVISNGGRIVEVAVPDGEVISVSLDRTTIFGKVEKADYVPLGS